ncbi:hypothetical protein [Streptomyces sp. NBC_01363]|uniref:hypothetical protein n=1 Tax=Streptomyces sp. NBC_01363 TaxID=2903840 RepID=UPI002B1D267F|nr:hypothetical protein [Streptomyces sp. NBC_01363]
MSMAYGWSTTVVFRPPWTAAGVAVTASPAAVSTEAAGAAAAVRLLNVYKETARGGLAVNIIEC